MRNIPLQDYVVVSVPFKGFDLNRNAEVQALRFRGYRCVGALGMSDDRLNLEVTFEAPNPPSFSYLAAVVGSQVALIIASVMAVLQWG